MIKKGKASVGKRKVRSPTEYLLLSKEEVIEMHFVLLDRFGGEEGGGHRGPADEGAEAAVQAVKNSYYQTPQELAAAYAVYIVQGHVFMDGNKRTGSAAMSTFLMQNGLSMRRKARCEMTMVELQQRAEAGENTASLIQWLASLI